MAHQNPLEHIAFILDGNRRFAKRLMLEPWKGHEYGAKKVEQLLEWAREFGIKELTLYCLSLENFHRPKKELDYLMKLFKEEFARLKKDPRIHEHKIKVKFVGDTNVLEKELQKLIKEIEVMTKNYSSYKINFALAYGGRQEILAAVRKLIKEGKEINEKNMQDSLWLSSEPQLIIRTGGEKRISNFLLWQGVYSEWIFLDKMWPEFTKEDFKNCIEEFKKRKRRFGR